jgi:hypothetical protein
MVSGTIILAVSASWRVMGLVLIGRVEIDIIVNAIVEFYRFFVEIDWDFP